MSVDMTDPNASSAWNDSALEDAGNMDVVGEGAMDQDAKYLHPSSLPKADDNISMKSVGDDDDMIDLSPHPSPRPQDATDDGALDAHIDTTFLDQDNSIVDTQTELASTQMNDADDITFEDADGDSVDLLVGNDDFEPTVSQIPEVTVDHPEESANDAEAVFSEYPDLIDYSDVEDEPVGAATEEPHEPANPTAKATESADIEGLNPSNGETTSKSSASDHTETEAASKDAKEVHDPAEFENETTQQVNEQQTVEEQQKYSSHPVVIDYYNQWISLFKNSIPELVDCFDLDEETLYGTTSLVFDHLRKSTLIETDDTDYLEIHVPAMDLWIREKSDEAEQSSFADLLNTYLELHSHEGNYTPDPLFLTLTVRPSFKIQLEKLQSVTGSGGGFSRCEFLRSNQPDFVFSPTITEDYGDEAVLAIQEHEEENNDQQEVTNDQFTADLQQTNSHETSTTVSGDPAPTQELLSTGQGDFKEQRGSPDEDNDYEQDREDFETQPEEFDEDEGSHHDEEYLEINDPTAIENNHDELHHIESYEDQLDVQVAEQNGFTDHASENQTATTDSHTEANKEDGFSNEAESLAQAEHDSAFELTDFLNDAEDTNLQAASVVEKLTSQGGGTDIPAAAIDEFESEDAPEGHNEGEGEGYLGQEHGDDVHLAKPAHKGATEPVAEEEEFLIDYSDDEAEEVTSTPQVAHVTPKDTHSTFLDDEITFTDDEEDISSAKTPTKRVREEDDIGSEAKRVKS